MPHYGTIFLPNNVQTAQPERHHSLTMVGMNFRHELADTKGKSQDHASKTPPAATWSGSLAFFALDMEAASSHGCTEVMLSGLLHFHILIKFLMLAAEAGHRCAVLARNRTIVPPVYATCLLG